MKQLINILTGSLFLFGMSSCEKDLPVYETPDCWLNFVYYSSYDGSVLGTEEVTDEMRYASYSFVYVGEEVEVDTVWFEISTMGFVSDEDRPLELEQIQTGGNDAKADVHYVAFTNEELKAKYMIPARKTGTKIPVVVKRDPSLRNGDVTLQFTFKDNGYFKPGYDGLTTRTLSISSKLTKPSVWEESYCDYVFGLYGSEKHRLMIEWTGEKWDDAYIKELMDGDNAYVNYLAGWFARKLEEENAKREEAGEEPYKEEDGTPVSFEPKSWS